MNNISTFRKPFIFIVISLFIFFLLYLLYYVDNPIGGLWVFFAAGTLLMVALYCFIYGISLLFSIKNTLTDSVENTSKRTVSIASIIILLITGVTFILLPFLVKGLLSLLLFGFFIIPGVLLIIQGCRKLNIYMKERKKEKLTC